VNNRKTNKFLNGKLNLDKMVTHRFAFKDYLEAYKTIESCGEKYMKVMLDL